MDFFQKLAVALTVWTVIFLFATMITGIEEMTYGPYDKRRKVWHLMVSFAFVCGASATFLFVCT